MYVVGFTYCNMVYSQMPGDVVKDQEGMKNMINLGQNMAHLLNAIKKEEWYDNTSFKMDSRY